MDAICHDTVACFGAQLIWQRFLNQTATLSSVLRIRSGERYCLTAFMPINVQPRLA